MRILVVSHAFPPMIGGVETHLWDLAHGLSRRGHPIHCLVGGDASAERHGSVAVSRTPHLAIERLLRRRGQDAELDMDLLNDLCEVIAATIDQTAPELIHVHNAHHFAPEVAQACFQAAGSLPLVNSVHDRVGEHLYPEVLRFPWSYTVFASAYLARALPVAGPATVMHLGIDRAHFSAKGSRARILGALGRPIVFHPARLLRWKGVLVSVQAFALLRTSFPEATLVLCGSEQVVDEAASVSELRQEIETQARISGVEVGVRFLEFSRLAMPSAYRAADVVWYPTIDEEPLGLVPLEAMACGRPVVVSDSGGMTETVVDGETGFIVPKGDAEALARATIRVLRDSRARSSMSRNAIRHTKRFELSMYLTRMEALYEQVALAGSRL